MPHRAFVNVFDVYNRQCNTHYRQNENIIPAVLPLETIIKRFTYKVNQVLDNHRCQPCTQAHEDGHDIQETVTCQVPDFEIIDPGN